LPPWAWLDFDGAGGHGGKHGQGQHAGQIGWSLGGGGDGGHVLTQPGGQDLDRKRRHTCGHAEGDGRRPVMVAAGCGGGVGQLASEMDEYGRIGVGVGQPDA
jgi:hypothetical protein